MEQSVISAKDKFVHKQIITHFRIFNNVRGTKMYTKFQKLMQEKHVKAADVARATGISTSTLSDWKVGKSKPKLDKLVKIANYFGVSVSYFIDIA